MRMCTGFWVGIGAGLLLGGYIAQIGSFDKAYLLAGAALGMMTPYGKDSMKTQVGKSIHKLGVAVDHAVDSIVSEMR